MQFIDDHGRYRACLWLGRCLPLIMLLTAFAGAAPADHSQRLSIRAWSDAQVKAVGLLEGSATGCRFAFEEREGHSALLMDYHIPASGPQYIGISTPDQLGSAARIIHVWVYGDASGNAFDVRVRDGSGELHQWRLQPIDWKGWREVSFDLSKRATAIWGGDQNKVLDGDVELVGFFLGCKSDVRRSAIALGPITATGQFSSAALVTARLVDFKLGGLYFETDLDISLMLANRAAETLNVDLRVWWEDPLGQTRELLRREVKLSGDERTSIGIKYGPTQHGLYRLHAQTTVAGETRTHSTTFAYLPAEAAQAQDARLGMQTHFWHRRATYPDHFQVARLLGAGWVRSEMRWQTVETSKGQYSLPPYHERYGFGVKEQGLDVLMTLMYGNPLYGGDPASGRPITTDEQVEAFGRYAEWMAKKFAPVCQVFEVWNEPNGQGAWGGTSDPARYAQVLNAAYEGVKRANPKARVVAMATAGSDRKFIENVIKAGGAKFDAVSIHPYRWGRSPESTAFRGEMREVGALIKNLTGRDVPLWITEIGWPTHTGKSSATPEQAADWLVRAFVLAADSGVVEKYFYYDEQDDGLDPAEPEHHFGLMDHSLRPKLPAVAYRMLASAVASLPYDQMLYEKDGVYVARFGPRDGAGTLVIWGAEKTATLSLRFAAGQQIRHSTARGQSKRLEVAENEALTLGANATPIFLRDVRGIPQIAVTEGASAALQATSECYLNLFGCDREPVIIANVRTIIPSPQAGKLTVTVQDLERITRLTRTQEVDLRQAGRQRIPVSLQGSDKTFGYFVARVELHAADGTRLDADEIGYAVAAVPHATPADSFFGIHTWQMSEFPIGIAWNRLWDTGDRWERIEPARDQWNWRLMDEKVAEAQAKGIRLLWALGGTPQWAALQPESVGPAAYGKASNSPPDLAAWERFVRTVVSRYGQRIEALEIWNEPNLSDRGGFFAGTAAQYAEVARVMYTAAKSVNPKVRIVGCSGTANFLDWLEQLGKLGTFQFMDAVSFHTYTDPGMPEAAGIDRVIDAVQSTLSRYDAAGKPIWNTEVGFRNGARLGAWPAPADHEFVSEFAAALGHVRQALIHKSRNAEHYFIYGASGAYAPWSRQRVARLILPAALGMEHSVGSARFVKRLIHSQGPIWLLQFHDGRDGTNVVAAWSSGGAATLRAPAAKAMLRDLWGNPTVYDGKEAIRLTLSGAPQYLHGLTQQQIDAIQVELDENVLIPAGGSAWQMGENVRGQYELALDAAQNTPTLPVRHTLGLAPGITRNWSMRWDAASRRYVSESPVHLHSGDQLAFTSLRGSEKLAARFVASDYQMPPLPVPLLKRSITVDGDAGDWPAEAAVVRIASRVQVVLGLSSTPGEPDAWGGTGDLSATARLFTDGTALYGLVEVTDNRVAPTTSGSDAWLGDSVEVFLDARSAELGRPTAGPGVHQVSLAPVLPNQSLPVVRRRPLPGMTAASRLSDRGYTIEFRIPGASLPGLSLQPGVVLGLDLGLNDSDGTGDVPGRKSQMVWRGNSSNFRDASAFGRITIVERK